MTKRRVFTYISVALVFAASISLACTVFSGAYIDFWQMLSKAGQRLAFYFCELFGIEYAPPTVAPVVPPPSGDGGGVILPTNPDYLGARFAIWGNMLISGDTYTVGGYILLKYVMMILQWAMIAVPLGLLLWVLVKKIYWHPNTRHGIDTKPLRMHKTLSKVLYTPIGNNVKDTYNMIRDTKALKISLLLIWLFNFNIITIGVDVISFYLYFVVTFAFAELYKELLVIIANMRYLAVGGGFILIIGGLWLFDKWRKKHAVNKLESLEQLNKGVLGERDISTYKWGVMGSCKTMTMTDQALSLAVMDIEKAAELKTVCRKMFPYFPWLLYELEIEQQVQRHIVYNWASAVDYVDVLQQSYNDNDDIFGYDVKKYGMNYYNGVVANYLFDVLKNYIRLHILYTQYNSFILSNYPIREDRVMTTLGNTVQWDNSFFNFNKSADDSVYSKILNFDYLRMCKTLKNEVSNTSFEYGVVVITEDDKEQSNAVETLNDSTSSPYPNPKNDGINKTEKFIRHRATVMGHCFVHLLKDGQRYMSINADTREISTLERMHKAKKLKSTLPFFWLDKLFYNMVGAFYNKFEEKMRYYRGDNTLLMHGLKTLDKVLYNNYYRKHNRYSYKAIDIECEAGVLDGDTNMQTYYLCNAKILANRYNTATHESFFYDRSRRAGTGIADYPTYKSSTMSDEEFDAQNSYSRLAMTDPDWKRPYIEEEQKRKAIEKALANAIAKEEVKKIIG